MKIRRVYMAEGDLLDEEWEIDLEGTPACGSNLALGKEQ